MKNRFSLSCCFCFCFWLLSLPDTLLRILPLLLCATTTISRAVANTAGRAATAFDSCWQHTTTLLRSCFHFAQCDAVAITQPFYLRCAILIAQPCACTVRICTG